MRGFFVIVILYILFIFALSGCAPYREVQIPDWCDPQSLFDCRYGAGI